MDFNFRTINSYMPQRGSLFVENISLSAIFAPAGQPNIKIYKMVILNFTIEITDCPAGANTGHELHSTNKVTPLA